MSQCMRRITQARRRQPRMPQHVVYALRRVAVLLILPAVLALKPLFESWPVGVVFALKGLAVGHGGPLEGLTVSQLLLSPILGTPQVSCAQVRTAQVGVLQVSPA